MSRDKLFVKDKSILDELIEKEWERNKSVGTENQKKRETDNTEQVEKEFGDEIQKAKNDKDKDEEALMIMRKKYEEIEKRHRFVQEFQVFRKSNGKCTCSDDFYRSRYEEVGELLDTFNAISSVEEGTTAVPVKPSEENSPTPLEDRNDSVEEMEMEKIFRQRQEQFNYYITGFKRSRASELLQKLRNVVSTLPRKQVEALNQFYKKKGISVDREALEYRFKNQIE